MYPEGFGSITLVLGVINVIWLLGLTVVVWKNRSFVKKLIPNKGEGLEDKLKEVLEEVNSLQEFKNKSLGYIQKIVLKRYNPYHDTGGDQSFSAAFLDGKGEGMIVTSLHSRAGTRVFAKPVKEGKEGEYQFSEEEKEVVNEALRLHG
ncbi:MAG: DUF4446 family protein [Patescibacteria group bacterium]|nr:DUF4446 family protein [Patescibacteria group bacterium]